MNKYSVSSLWHCSHVQTVKLKDKKINCTLFSINSYFIFIVWNRSAYGEIKSNLFSILSSTFLLHLCNWELKKTFNFLSKTVTCGNTCALPLLRLLVSLTSFWRKWPIYHHPNCSISCNLSMLRGLTLTSDVNHTAWEIRELKPTEPSYI